MGAPDLWVEHTITHPEELAESMYAIHIAASDHFGELHAKHAIYGGEEPPSYDRILDTLRTMARSATMTLTSPSDAACFLTHEACRAAHRYALHPEDYAMLDVSEILLEEAAQIVRGAVPKAYTDALDNTRSWFTEEPHKDASPACQHLRESASTWPQCPYYT